MIPKADFGVFKVTCHLAPGDGMASLLLALEAWGSFAQVDFLNRKIQSLGGMQGCFAFMGMLTESQEVGCLKGTLEPSFPLPSFSFALYRGL